MQRGAAQCVREIEKVRCSIPQSVAIGPICGPTGPKTPQKRAHRSTKRTYSHAWKQTTRQGKEMARKNAVFKKESFPEGFQGSSPGQPLRGNREATGVGLESLRQNTDTGGGPGVFPWQPLRGSRDSGGG